MDFSMAGSRGSNEKGRKIREGLCDALGCFTCILGEIITTVHIEDGVQGAWLEGERQWKLISVNLTFFHTSTSQLK